MKPYVEPRELTLEELPSIVDGFKKAAENAKLAGFDGVEVHAANGYLLDEFLRDGSNQRTDIYGGSIENRARLTLEVLQAVCDVWGSERVGLRISPLNSFNSMIDSDPVTLSTWFAKRLNDFNLAYLHVMRADFYQQQTGDVLTPIRENYQGVLIGNMGYDAKEAEEAVTTGKLDAVSFGVSFIANPDLPERIKTGADLNTPNPENFYVGGEVGYIDYPALG
jgi:N-ethylmaleimide reductase